jgi:hypothetical protein
VGQKHRLAQPAELYTEGSGTEPSALVIVRQYRKLPVFGRGCDSDGDGNGGNATADGNGGARSALCAATAEEVESGDANIQIEAVTRNIAPRNR